MHSGLPKNNLQLEQKGLERSALRPVPSDAGKRPPLHLVTPEGQIQVHTAPYRGSFSLVMSNALRAAGLGSRVLVAQFLKGGVNQGPSGCINLCGKLQWLRPAIPNCLGNNIEKTGLISKDKDTQEAVQDVWRICKDHVLKGDIEQIVLDEVGLAIALGYLGEDDVLTTLEQRPKAMDVILVGPSIPKRIITIADQVTELRCGT